MSTGGAPTASEKTVGILIYPDAEVLDFCGPFEVFAMARLNEETRRETGSPIRQLLISEEVGEVRVTGGMRMLADVDFSTCPKLDLLLVPGGDGVRALMHQPEYLEWLQKMAGQVERLASVGTGSLLLAEAGLLVGKTATTHFYTVDLFRERYPRTTLIPELPIVVDGNITTAASIRAGVEMALYLVTQFYGTAVAREAARQMEFPYGEGANSRPKGEGKNDAWSGMERRKEPRNVR